jgi:UDP-glucose:(heptosyl)LPS alpha-1,3-glucosyltransferase
MDVAVVNRLYTLHKGGAERYCVNLCRALAALGHRVTVIGQKIDAALRTEVSFQRVPVLSWTSFLKNLSFASSVSSALSSARHDVVYGLTLAPSVDVVRATGRLHAHWMKFHYPHPWRRTLEHWNPRHRAILDLESFVYRKSSSIRVIVAQSQIERRLLMQLYRVPEHKIEVIYNGVDTTLFHPGSRDAASDTRRELGLADGQPALLFAAASDFRSKGLMLCLQALALTKEREARLLVVGDQPQRRFLRTARELGISHRVSFLGRRSDIQTLYAAADLFLLPTIYEPFPNVNLEAMACGTPVMTSDTAGGADIIREGENGYVIRDNRAAREMANLLDHHFQLTMARRQEISQNCLLTAQSMTLDDHARRIVDLLTRVRAAKG